MNLKNNLEFTYTGENEAWLRFGHVGKVKGLLLVQTFHPTTLYIF